jgi:uncharacterized protein
VITREQIHRYCAAIAAVFRPAKIILFGSHAYGEPTADSDVDVLVVMPQLRGSRHALATRIREEIACDFPVDVLVRGEPEIRRRLREKDLFITHVITAGSVMYEAVDA